MSTLYDSGELETLALEAAWERRQRNRRFACQCGGDMPGTCPGPANCPMCDDETDEDDDE
jgi:hypothetical protein